MNENVILNVNIPRIEFTLWIFRVVLIYLLLKKFDIFSRLHYTETRNLCDFLRFFGDAEICFPLSLIIFISSKFQISYREKNSYLDLNTYVDSNVSEISISSKVGELWLCFLLVSFDQFKYIDILIPLSIRDRLITLMFSQSSLFVLNIDLNLWILFFNCTVLNCKTNQTH